MCESNAYLVTDDGQEELVMESVSFMKLDGDKVFLRSLFGEEMSVNAAFREMNLTAQKILLDPQG